MTTGYPPLILGTAEFNPKGYAGKNPPTEQEIVRILNLAWEAGIRTIATSESYGCTPILNKYAHFFYWIINNRKADSCFLGLGRNFYHYQEDEPAQKVELGSVYKVQQLEGLVNAIVPMSINNTDFIKCRVPHYIRSVFDRGRLLQQGYSIKDCLSFVKRQGSMGIIIGVNSVRELNDILKVY